MLYRFIQIIDIFLYKVFIKGFYFSLVEGANMIPEEELVQYAMDHGVSNEFHLGFCYN